MTELLEQAIAKLKTLPASEQNAIAVMILEEIEDMKCDGMRLLPSLKMLLLN